MPRQQTDRLFSVITPSAGLRPRALTQAIRSVEAARVHAGLPEDAVEHLLGFDDREAGFFCKPPPYLRALVLPRPAQGACFGNHIRHTLMGLARGERLLFLDDDNTLTPEAFSLYLAHPGADMVIARVDTTRAFDTPFLPRPPAPGQDPAADAVKPGNIDPLCLCVSRRLALSRCGGWSNEGGYASDYLNILRYFRRARQVVRIEGVAGVYDAGRGLDPEGLNLRQQRLEGSAD